LYGGGDYPTTSNSVPELGFQALRGSASSVEDDSEQRGLGQISQGNELRLLRSGIYRRLKELCAKVALDKPAKMGHYKTTLIIFSPVGNLPSNELFPQ
jgi:hypothetical protein